jgi:M6 family metalloprotease-like protein
MKKNLLALAVAALTVASASAVPAKRLVQTLTQPDGTTITVTQMGDERYHTFVTSDGLSVDITPEGHAVYVTTDGVSDVYAHELAERTAAEKSFIAAKSTKMTFQANRAASPRYQAMKNHNTAKAVEPKRVQGKINIEHQDSQVPHKGTAKVPIILVQYKDIKFKDSDPKSTFENFFMEGDVSAHQYFTDMSQGQYDPQFEVYGPYTLSNNRSYYGGNDSWGNDKYVGTMVKEAVNLANADVDYSEFDNDNDGNCDVMIVLYAGVGEASSGVKNSVWPCQWDLASSDAGANLTLDGVTISDFAVFNELNGTSTSKIDGIGTFCHEFSHCLGLPDFYETTYSYGYYGMNEWSLMDFGSYNNDGYTPVGYSAYEKAFMGWITLTEGQANTKYELPVLNKVDDPQSLAVVLVNSADNNEYFIFENRDQQGWDKYMSDKGMMINHVTYSASAWNNNTVNNTSTQRMTIVPADNKLTESTNSADLWPKSYATEFTNTSTPSNKTNKGSYLNRDVTEITRNSSTGVVSFWVDKAALPTLSAPNVEEPVVEERGSFTASWAPVTADDVDVTYTLQVWPKTTNVSSAELWTNFQKNKLGNTGWTTANQANIFNTYAMLGSATQSGSITSEEKMEPSDGTITIAANVKRYGSDTEGIIELSAIDGNGNVAATATCDASFKDATFVSAALTGLDDSKTYSIRLANNAGKKRVMIYSVMGFAGSFADADADVYAAALADAEAGASSAPAREPSITTSGERITISGITDTSYTVTDLTGDVYRFRVKAVPADANTAYESEWSVTQQVEFSTSGIAEAITEQAQASWLVVNGQLVATPGARLFSVSGAEVKALSAGRFAPAPGAYILVTPGCRPAKIVL